MSLRDNSIDDLVAAVQTSVYAPSSNNPQSIMAVVGRCTIEMSDQVKQLSTDINHAKEILGLRVTELTRQIEVAANQASADINAAKQAFLPAVAELVTELKNTRLSITEAGSAASTGTDKLVRWTKALVFATIVYAFFTGGLLIVTYMQLRAAGSLSAPASTQLPAAPKPPSAR